MTVAAVASYLSYVGNGVQTTYPYPFLLLDATHLQVYVAGTLTLAYTVTGLGEPSGGTLVMTAPPAAGALVQIYRVLPLDQPTHYAEGDPFPAQAHERALDRLALQVQQVTEALERRPGFPASSPQGLRNLVLPRAPSKLLAWNSEASGLTLVDPTSTSPITDPGLIDDASGSIESMRAQIDPGEVGTESYPTDMTGEFLRLRARVAEITGMDYWYQTGTGIRAQSLTRATFPPAGRAGRLARAADSGRGLWLDNGALWVPPPHVTVAEFATGGDGTPANPWTGWEPQLQATGSLPPGAYHFGVGAFSFANTLRILGANTHLVGQGRGATQLLYTGTGTAVSFNKGALGPSYHNALRHLYLAPANTSAARVGVDVVDQSHFALEHVWLNNWIGGGGSVALQVRGREALSFRDLYAVGDYPLLIATNPFSIDCDHAHFQNLDLTGNGMAHPVVTVTANNLTNVTFDGHQAWEFGSAGFQWLPTAATGISTNLTLRNIRWEQSSVNGWFVDIEHNYYLVRLVIDQCYAGAGLPADVRGIKLRSVSGVQILNTMYGSTSTGLDVDGSVVGLSWDNTFWQTGCTLTLGGQTEVFAIASRPQVNEAPHTAYYRQTAPGYQEIRLMGSSYWQKTGTIAAGAQTPALDFFALGHTMALVTVAALSPDGSVQAGGQAITATIGAWKLSGTANFQAAIAAPAGYLTLLYIGPTQFTLANGFGVPVNYVITASGLP